jgi:NAD(P)-dependent dehydrogenase (short-subunit alcohol dehydrogenase family)
MTAAPADAPAVLVTGAARRLGRAIALACARAGWRVAVHARADDPDARQTVADCARHTPGSTLFVADLADEAQMRALIPAVAGRMGRIDAVVNNAALFAFDDAASFTSAHLARHMAINTAAPVLLAQALAVHLAQRGADPGNGCVVNLLDQKLWNPNPDFLSYTLSKAALQAATVTLAQALAPRVRVVGVAPGLTLPSQHMDQARFAALHRISPLGAASNAEEVAASVVFLLTSRAITGATLLVDGGQHLIPLTRDFSMMQP